MRFSDTRLSIDYGISVPRSETSSDELQASYDDAFSRERDGGSFYAPFDEQPPFLLAAHERRMELLARMELGDLTQSTCVDYGCGSWGFAAIFPQLHACREAIGIDISPIALEASRLLEEKVNHPTREATRFLQSAGASLPLEDQSVDVFFAGESIEHVVLTRAFVDEMHRVLKPNGLLIVTTPNSASLTYRSTGQHFARGPEHVALMSYDELVEYLTPAFDIGSSKGFNASYLPGCDSEITNPDIVSSWCSAFENNAADATCVVVAARRKSNHHSVRWSSETMHHSDGRWIWTSAWEQLSLHARMTGRGASGVGQRACLDFVGEGFTLLLWSHRWSGLAEILIDGLLVDSIDLYEASGGGFVRFDRFDLGPGQHRAEVRVSERVHPHALGNQVIIHQAVSYGPMSREEP